MACNANKVHFLRALAKRGFSAQSCPRQVGEIGEVHTTTLPNKAVVASAPSSLPIARVSIVFRAGSRFESYDTLGASHMLRLCAGLSTMNSTGFAITRNIQQIGGNLTASSDREIVAYTVEATANNIDCALRYLQDVINPAFKPWELKDSVPRMKTQVQAVPPQFRAVELVHQAAFRNGLGNSVFCPKHQIGKISSESLLHYVANYCTSERCAIVGVGVDPNTLSGFAQNLEIPAGEGKSESAHYYGGDARKDTGSNLAHVAVCGEGGCLCDPKEALAFAVLQHAAGSEPSVKYGTINGYIAKEALSISSDNPILFTAFNANYSDTGIFGFVLTGDGKNAGKAVEAAANALKSGEVSEQDVNRGKALLKAALYERYTVDSNLIDEIGTQAAIKGSVENGEKMLADVDGISTEDVKKAAQKVAASKLSIGAVGNLENIPYSSDLS